MKTPIKLLPNGQMEITISYDVTQHGHSFGAPRNYDVKKIAKMINSKSVQEEISNGYCKGYYGHGNRNKSKGYLPTERNDDGEVVEPVCITKALSIKGNTITHTQRIFNTDEGMRVQKLAENGAIGFSNVWNINTGKFYGYDAVLSPNFHGNSVIVDGICEDGQCQIGNALDAIVDEAVGDIEDETVREYAKDLLMHQQDVQDTIKIQEYIKDLRVKLDEVEKERDAEKERAIEAEKEVDKKDEEIEASKDENKKLEDEKDLFLDECTKLKGELSIKEAVYEDREARYKDEISSMKDEIKKTEDAHKTELDSLGIVRSGGTLEETEKSLRSLFSQGDFDSASKVTEDSIALLPLKKVDPARRSSLEAFKLGWPR